MKNETLTIAGTRAKKAPFFLDKLIRSTFYIKLTNWEYWPMYVANFPLLIIWLWFALRAKKLFFFSAVNPAIETGGMWGESKYNILKKIPAAYLPKTIFVKKGSDLFWLKEELNTQKINYPFIAKPDVGERGTLVVKIKTEKDLASYLNKNNIDFLVQEYISFPVELSIMHHRMPDGGAGSVTSVCIKETLKVEGDGVSNIRELMEENPRAKLQVKRFEKTHPDLLKVIPQPREIIEVEPIGNHCRGTMFLNGNSHIDGEMTEVINKVAKKMDDIYYGRFDLKCNSIAELKKGRNFKIMEYNGIGAEPAHIYDPTYPLLKKYGDIYRHWKIIYAIYREQNKKGVEAMSVKEAVHRLKAYSDYQKSLQL